MATEPEVEPDGVPGARLILPRALQAQERRRAVGGKPDDDLIERASRVMPQVVLESARLLRMLA